MNSQAFKQSLFARYNEIKNSGHPNPTEALGHELCDLLSDMPNKMLFKIEKTTGLIKLTQIPKVCRQIIVEMVENQNIDFDNLKTVANELSELEKLLKKLEV